MPSLSVSVCSHQCIFPIISGGTVKFSIVSKINPPPPTTATASHQARRELRQLKEEARKKNAVSVIWAGWQGTKVFLGSLLT